MENQFKGTKGKWHVVDYAGWLVIQDGDYYEDNNILDCDKVGTDIAKANALLISKAPEMLECLQSLENDNNAIPKFILDKIQQLIKEATTL